MPATRVTWRDVLEIPEDGNRYEAIDGELHMSPPPKNVHQVTIASLIHLLHDILEQPGYGHVLFAPIGVEFPDTDEGVQPDILFVSKARQAIVTRDWIRGAPDLVIEVLSPSTARRDRTVKKELYQRQGVGEYWIVDTNARQVEVWHFMAGAIQPDVFNDKLPVLLDNRLVGEIDLARIFDWPWEAGK